MSKGKSIMEGAARAASTAPRPSKNGPAAQPAAPNPPPSAEINSPAEAKHVLDLHQLCDSHKMAAHRHLGRDPNESPNMLGEEDGKHS